MDQRTPMTRYARQSAVPEIGAHGQAAIAAARLLVIGAGGLAAPLLPAVAGAGVGFIRLVDPDVVDLSNLHRQTLFRTADIGRPKVEAARAQLIALNPDCVLDVHQAALTPATMASLAHDVTMVIDCADSFAASYIMSDYCLAHGLPLISASVIGVSGYAGGFCAGAPSLRAVFPDLPPRLGNCAEDGVLGPMVALVGALQAEMAMAAILRSAPSPLGQLITVEGPSPRFGGFRFDGAPEPDFAPRFIAGADITPQDWVVDLREAHEAPLAKPTAMRWPVTSVGTAEARPAQNQRAVLCCRSGLRAWTAAERLHAVWPGEIVLAALGSGDWKGTLS